MELPRDAPAPKAAAVPEIPNTAEFKFGVTGVLDYPCDEPLHGETPVAVETEIETGYVYMSDNTSSGPVNQWETLKHLTINGYETQEDKAKRNRTADIISNTAE